ncbi:MAG: fumarylacetoacetate hydrolase family protein [Promethearchaeota archaeon]|jgi:2-keto-4-pentenoate hydratase/2-oxohepta-3-ene-1,7-dioic acid hydratase in catechol pathway
MVEIGDISINPTKIICLGTNYMDHIEETGLEVPKEPLLFPKTLNCLITNNQPIIYPKYLFNNRRYNRVDYEVELAFIVKDRCKNISSNDAYDHILGYTVFNDVTARKMQTKDIISQKPWFRSKSFDTFGPIGPVIKLVSEIKDPHNLEIELRVNGEVKQKSNTKHLLFKIPETFEFITQLFTMEPGDIVATGTPGGIGKIVPGDIIEATIQNIGTLTNKVILEGDDNGL